MRKHLILTIALLSLAALSSYAQKTTTMEYNRERVYTTETKVKKVWYQGEVNFGVSYGLGVNYKNSSEGKWHDNQTLIKPFITTIHGIRITKWAFLGIGVGANYTLRSGYYDSTHYYDNGNYVDCNLKDVLLVYAFLNARFYYPITNRFSLYLTASGGYDGAAVCPDNVNGIGGFYGEYGIGMNYRRLNISLGYQQQGLGVGDRWSDDRARSTDNGIYFKIGIAW